MLIERQLLFLVDLLVQLGDCVLIQEPISPARLDLGMSIEAPHLGHMTSFAWRRRL